MKKALRIVVQRHRAFSSSKALRVVVQRHRTFSSSRAPACDLPIINVAPLVNGDDDEAKLACARAIDAACRHHGFFYVQGHGVPCDLLSAVVKHGRDKKETVKTY